MCSFMIQLVLKMVYTHEFGSILFVQSTGITFCVLFMLHLFNVKLKNLEFDT